MKRKEISRRIIEGMRARGLKLTRQRLAIIDIIADEKNHPAAFEVFKKARKKVPTISLSTIYYALDVMKRAGLIKVLEFTDRENRYEGDISDHLNLICKKCGKIMDFHVPLELHPEHVEKKTGFKGESVRFDYYGTCRKCQKNRG